MTDLTKLTAKGLLKRCADYQPIYTGCNTFDEIRRRLERLEQCEADSQRIDWLEFILPNGDVFLTPYGAEVPRIVWRDSGTHRHESYGDGVRAAIDAARAALEGK